MLEHRMFNQKEIEKLNSLIEAKILLTYAKCNVDISGTINEYSDYFNNERLILTFSNGEELIINSKCTGSSENSILEVSNE